jgi:hypothetical protein
MSRENIVEYVYALIATNNWWSERKTKGAHHYIIRVIPPLFQAIDSLYLNYQNLPLLSVRGIPISMKKVDTSYTINLGIFLQNNGYSTLRNLLSLTGDIYNFTTPLKDLNSSELLELKTIITSLFKEADKFREIRNTYTHLDEVLTNMDRHGVDGYLLTDCNLEYSHGVKSCVHLMWDDKSSTIYYTYFKKALKIVIDKKAFAEIFNLSRQLYKKLLENKVDSKAANIKDSSKLYPL